VITVNIFTHVGVSHDDLVAMYQGLNTDT